MARIPINLSTGTLKESNLIVGIDLGTTHSLIAKMQDGKPTPIADFGKEAIVPSVVHVGANGFITGDEAIPFLLSDPYNTIYSVKRLMAQSFQDVKYNRLAYILQPAPDDPDGLVRIKARDQLLTPTEVSSLILKELKQRAEHRLKNEVRQAVITVPAYFNEAQRQATRDAGKLADLDVLRIINEPTAAALAYGMGVNQNEKSTIAVYDLGGGTFDVTILKIENGVFDVLATNGNAFLGGDDFDIAIVSHWVRKYDMTFLPDDNLLLQNLRLGAETVKIQLSDALKARVTLPYNGEAKTFELSRSELNEIITPYIQRTIQACQNALNDAGLTTKDIDAVIMVGGSTRALAVKQQVGQFFEKTPLDELNPDEVVALGAAVMADIIAGNRPELLLLDVTPLSLGLETLGGLMDVLIQRNSKIPTRATRAYTTSVDGQVNLKVNIFQGEREETKYNRKLAEFDLRGIPPMPAGLPKVEITFALDADGVLTVTAKESRSGVQQEIHVKPQYGLTDEQVEKMLLDSFTFAQIDIENRLVLESQQEAKVLIYFAEKFLHNHGSQIDTTDYTTVKELIQDLSNQISFGTKEQIVHSIQELEKFTRPFAEQMMDEAVKKAIIGKEVL